MNAKQPIRSPLKAPDPAPSIRGSKATAPVTVVIPARDRAVLLGEALRSVTEQARPPAAIIVCDDGSTEDVGAVATRAGAVHLRNEHGGWGAAGARNAGLALVQTPLVWFHDSDDLLLPTAIEWLVAAIEAEPSAPFAYGRGLVAERSATGWEPLDLIETRRAEMADLEVSLYVRNSVAPSTLVRTEAVREVGGFDEDAEYSEDHRLWIELAALGTPVHLPEPVMVYRVHPGNRHTPLRALDFDVQTTTLAADKPDLRSHSPRRRGVILADTVSEARHSGRRREVPGLLWKLMLSRRGRLATCWSAARHLIARRRGPRRAQAFWEAHPKLTTWLATFQ